MPRRYANKSGILDTYFRPGYRLGFKLSDENKRRLSENKLGDNNPMWKGEDVDIPSLREWVRTRLTKPDICPICNMKPVLDLVNLTGIWSRDLSNWQYQCRSCVMKRDGRTQNLLQNSGEDKIRLCLSKRYPLVGQILCSVCGENYTEVRKDTGRPRWTPIGKGLMECRKCRDTRIYWRNRVRLFGILGMSRCVHCGNDDIRCLQFDHINGGGRKDMRRYKHPSSMLTFYINNPDLAKETLQVLCANCNWIKRYVNREYPSQSKL